jgi:hypothetical protein
MTMRWFTTSGTEIAAPDVTVSLTDDYTTRPTFLRVYDEGDIEHPWMIDGIDHDGVYTEACYTFATEAEAVAALTRFMAENGYEDGGPKLGTVTLTVTITDVPIADAEQIARECEAALSPIHGGSVVVERRTDLPSPMR